MHHLLRFLCLLGNFRINIRDKVDTYCSSWKCVSSKCHGLWKSNCWAIKFSCGDGTEQACHGFWVTIETQTWSLRHEERCRLVVFLFFFCRWLWSRQFLPPRAFSISCPPLTLFLQGAGALDALRCLRIKAVNNQQKSSSASFEFS